MIVMRLQAHAGAECIYRHGFWRLGITRAWGRAEPRGVHELQIYLLGHEGAE